MINFLPVPVSPNCRWPENPISIQRLFPPNVTTVHKKTIVSAFKALVPGRRHKHRKSQTKVTTKSAELAPPKAEPSAAVEEEGMQLQNEQPANDAIAVAGNGSQQTQNPAPAAAGGRFKSVLFDMGGVLVKYKNPCAYEDLVKKARTNKTIAKCLQDFDLGLKSAEELRDLFAELMPNMPRCNVEQVAQVENTAILDECLLAIVPQLREHGLKVGIVTNNGFWSNQRQRTVMLSDVSLFDLVIESCKLGLRKPSPQIFLKAAELLGVQPDQCIFIDDTEGHCRGAESVGMTAIHMANCETAPVVKKLARLLEVPLSTVKHRITMVDNGRRETFMWTYSPHFGWLNHPTSEKEHGNGAEKSDEEEEEPFYW